MNLRLSPHYCTCQKRSRRLPQQVIASSTAVVIASARATECQLQFVRRRQYHSYQTRPTLSLRAISVALHLQLVVLFLQRLIGNSISYTIAHQNHHRKGQRQQLLFVQPSLLLSLSSPSKTVYHQRILSTPPYSYLQYTKSVPSSSFSTATSLMVLTATNDPNHLSQQQNKELKEATTTKKRSNHNMTSSKRSPTKKGSVSTSGKEPSSSSSKIINKNSDSVQSWRVYGVEVHPDRLVDTGSCSSRSSVIAHDNNTMKKNINEPNHNSSSPPQSTTTTTIDAIHPAILEVLRLRLNIPVPGIDTTETKLSTSTSSSSSLLWSFVQSVQIVRRSVDARSNQQRSDQLYGPRYIYVMDVTINTTNNRTMRPWKHQPGRMERLALSMNSLSSSTDLVSSVAVPTTTHPIVDGTVPPNIPVISLLPTKKKPCVIIVGAGPAGLFCALQLAKSGVVTPIILERGQPVETRGKDIGALIHRKSLNTESNFAFGEGGAGTWSDGKLTTRIGRNSNMVRKVLETLVQYGAPSNILIEGAPHLGTDNLVRLLRNMRQDLRRMGGIIRFGTKVTELIIENNITVGVKYECCRETIERNVGTVEEKFDDESSFQNGILMGDSVVLATGHSARDVYEQLHVAGVRLEEKGFAVGFRVEHPQTLINHIQYGQEWGPSVVTGKGTTDTANTHYFSSRIITDSSSEIQRHEGTLPVPSYRLATDKAHDGKSSRGVYSFCMCPGGQIVPASTEPDEVCVNGMSLSRRDSLFANSALVVTIDPQDEILEPYRSEHGVLAGIAFQQDMERRAATLVGGNFVVPVQRVTDFLNNTASTSAPPSSYRLGVNLSLRP